LTTTYEGMFLLDNQVVRADWRQAKAMVTDLLAKNGAKVLCARRWDERKLAYPIRGRTRGTYLLAYFEITGTSLNGMRRDFELDERVLRYLMLKVDAIPAGEMEKAAEEGADGYVVPPPPTEEATSPERAVFGDLADRPIQENLRRNAPAEAPEGGDGAEAEVPEAAAAEES
jgi:ribosomal protein S6